MILPWAHTGKRHLELQNSSRSRKCVEDQRTPSPSCFALLVRCNYQMGSLEYNWSGFQQKAGSRPYSCRVTGAPGHCRRSSPLGGAAHQGRSEAAPRWGSSHAACREGVAEARLLAAQGTPQTHRHPLKLQAPHPSVLTGPVGAPRPCELAWVITLLHRGAPPILGLSASP